MEDKTLVCKECGHQFVFSVRDQEFYQRAAWCSSHAGCPAVGWW
ncbi:MAG: zinc-ribbon domain containing protein [Vulcanimicrobiaceae bacterium]